MIFLQDSAASSLPQVSEKWKLLVLQFIIKKDQTMPKTSHQEEGRCVGQRRKDRKSWYNWLSSCVGAEEEGRKGGCLAE